jgi:hypothetical protein
MYRSGLVNTLVTHANIKGFGRTPLLGDRRGFMLPQLKTNRKEIDLTALDWLRPGELQEVPPKNGYFQINFIILARIFLYFFQHNHSF